MSLTLNNCLYLGPKMNSRGDKCHMFKITKEDFDFLQQIYNEQFDDNSALKTWWSYTVDDNFHIVEKRGKTEYYIKFRVCQTDMSNLVKYESNKTLVITYSFYNFIPKHSDKKMVGCATKLVGMV